jgi:monoterpene epsilon-lactone hydrolase
MLFCGAAMCQDEGGRPANVRVEANGTVYVPAHAVPISALMSPEGQAYLADHLLSMKRPELFELVDGVPRLLIGFIDRQRELFPVERRDITIAGVHAYEYIPRAGIAEDNRDRVLINLHGGGFSGCWPACAELESMPVAALGRVRVVSLDYREAPEHRFPAASEDVAAVYRELLADYPAENIGIYGCSAGGMLTGMAVAWFQVHSLPRPGAVGVLCAGLTLDGGGFGGDSVYGAMTMGEGRPPPAASPDAAALPPMLYLDGVAADDPLAAPASSPEVLAQFPPTLIVTGTRGFELSAAVHAHADLVRQGVEADLHVWEGMFHGFFYNADVPESRDCFDVIVRFFDRHLGR